VTINLPRIAYEAENELDFFDILEKRMELAKESLIIKRDVLERFTDKGLYPYSMFYLRSIKKAFGQYWKNHFSTIGIIGMNDALLNFSGHDITHPAGRAFAIKVMDFMRKKLADFQEETGNIFNLEATPAEGASYRLAKIDNKLFPKMKVYNQLHYGGKKSEPYYTNSTQLPVGFTNDIFVALKLQDPLQTKYTGGCIEKGNKVLTDKGLLNIEYIVKNFEKLIPIKALSYNSEKGISEWDEIVDAIDIDVEKRNKIRMKGERNLDITTSDWHPFFILEKINVNPACPVCGKKVKNVKAFAAHLRYNKKCRKKYSEMNKYRVVEKRGDELKRSDYILQNSDNLYPARKTELNDDLMWLIGFFSGDGSISEFIDKRGGNNLRRYKVRFYSEQKKSLEKAGRILARYFHVKAKVIQNDRRSKKLKEVTTSKKSVWHFFFKYGFRPGKKVYNVCIPQKIKENINKNNVFSLLSGLAGSDGHISKRDGDFEYSTVSPRLANDILEICSRAGIMVSKKEKPSRRKNEVNIYRLRIPQYQMTRIRDKMNITVNHARIKNTLSNRKKRQLPVIRVKEVSKVDVNDNKFYDLMTNKNHNYLAGKNSLVFVHNTVLHGFIGEKMPSTTVTKALVKTIAENFHLPYFTVTPSFSICERHGYISGEHDKCPKCGAKCEVWSRSVGYLRPVEQWNAGKQAEFKDRKTYDKQLHVQTMPKKG